MNEDIYVLIEHLQGEVAEISYIMLAAARDLAQRTSGEVIGVLLGHDAQDLTSTLAADHIIYADHAALAEFTADAYQKTVASLIQENEPSAFLFGNTSIGADVASVLSARLSLPLVSSCVQISNGKLISQICGGKIMAESDLAETTTLVTIIPGGYKAEEGQSEKSPEIKSFNAPALDDLRVTLKKYVEPEAGDVNISKEAILVSIGRGIQTEDNINQDKIIELLKLLKTKHPGNGKIYLILDNASYNKALRVRAQAEESQIIIKYQPPYSPNLNLIEHLWNELERRLRPRPSRSTSVCDLTNALLQER